MLGKATDVDVSCRRLTHDDLTMLHRWVNEFFVKQKTAYEIWRDWSSDVCSSDLQPPLPELAEGGGREPRARARLRGAAGDPVRAHAGRLHRAVPDAAQPGRQLRLPRQHRGLEIGRASCRESV